MECTSICIDQNTDEFYVETDIDQPVYYSGCSDHGVNFNARNIKAYFKSNDGEDHRGFSCTYKSSKYL